MKRLIESGKRYSGDITIERFCEKFGINMNFDLIFSGFIEALSDSEIKVSSINPQQVKKIFSEKKDFSLYISNKKETFVAKGFIIEFEKDYLIAKIEKTNLYLDKRRFHRFHFCCKDLGDFIIEKNNNIISESACIYEISRTGLGVLNPVIDSILAGDIIELSNNVDNIVFKMKVLHVKKAGKYDILGGEIIESNKNLINYIITKYIKVSEELIL